MLPRERVFAALDHREPDRIPWGEHSIDYNVYEDILGRETFVQAKMKETQAYWDGRRDEVVESHKRDRLDLVRALEMDVVFVARSCCHQGLSRLWTTTRSGSGTGELFSCRLRTFEFPPPNALPVSRDKTGRHLLCAARQCVPCAGSHTQRA